MNRTIFGVPRIRISISVIIATILFVAALIKMIYPLPDQNGFYLTIGISEILLGLILLFFSRNWKVWGLIILVLSAWGGYSFYSTIFGVPCSCLGVVVFPRGVTLAVDLVMLAAAWAVFTQMTRKSILLLSALVFIIGFIFANLIV